LQDLIRTPSMPGSEAQIAARVLEGNAKTASLICVQQREARGCSFGQVPGQSGTRGFGLEMLLVFAELLSE
jgi:hypothetical protein